MRLGGLYVDMLDGNKKMNWSDSYRVGLDFIATALKENPADYRVFMSLVEREYGIITAVAIYDTLPVPVKAGDYEARAELFKESNWWTPDWVGRVAQPHGDSTIAERITILEGLKRCFGDYRLQEADEKLKRTFPSGRDYAVSGSMMVELFNAMGHRPDDEQYATALALVSGRFKGRPGEFRAFLTLVKSGMNVNPALKVMDLLAKPVKDETVEERSAAFSQFFTHCKGHGDPVDAAMKEYGTFTGSIDEKESLSGAFKRYDAIYNCLNAVEGKKPAKQRQPVAPQAIDAFAWITVEKKRGSFGETGVDEVTGLLGAELVMDATVDEAKRAVLAQFERAREKEFIDDDDTLTIDGIKLKKRKER